MNSNVSLSALPGWLVATIMVMLVVEVGVEVIALVRLARTPTERVVFGRKWPWVLIILFIELVGAVVFLAAGRRPAPVDDPARTPVAPETDAGDRAARTVDLLYGEDERR